MIELRLRNSIELHEFCFKAGISVKTFYKWEELFLEEKLPTKDKEFYDVTIHKIIDTRANLIKKGIKCVKIEKLFLSIKK